MGLFGKEKPPKDMVNEGLNLRGRQQELSSNIEI